MGGGEGGTQLHKILRGCVYWLSPPLKVGLGGGCKKKDS